MPVEELAEESDSLQMQQQPNDLPPAELAPVSMRSNHPGSLSTSGYDTQTVVSVARRRADRRRSGQSEQGAIVQLRLMRRQQQKEGLHKKAKKVLRQALHEQELDRMRACTLRNVGDDFRLDDPIFDIEPVELRESELQLPMGRLEYNIDEIKASSANPELEAQEHEQRKRKTSPETSLMMKRSDIETIQQEQLLREAEIVEMQEVAKQVHQRINSRPSQHVMEEEEGLQGRSAAAALERGSPIASGMIMVTKSTNSIPHQYIQVCAIQDHEAIFSLWSGSDDECWGNLEEEIPNKSLKRRHCTQRSTLGE